MSKTNPDNNSSTANQGGANQGGANQGDHIRSTDLRDSPMMARLLDALESGEDVGDYGRLTFVIVARHFFEEDELVRLLSGQPGMDEDAARAQVRQVQARDYNPPKRSTILEWQSQQEFQICPEADDPTGCNVYRELEFPQEVYDRIGEFWEEQAQAGD